jgi:hypothetical protein
MAEALGLVEAVNRKERLEARNKEVTDRDEKYRNRVHKYPTSTGDPKKIRRLDPDGKPLPGARPRTFNRG